MHKQPKRFFFDAVVLSDDKIARAYCAKHAIPYTGTIGILKADCLDGSITVNYADKILKEMIKEGFYSPVQTISSIL